MSLLSQTDRDYILNQLKLAPDHVLADAMLVFNAVRDKIVMVRKMVEIDTAPVNPAPEVVAERPNVDPGKSSITRIGAGTLVEIVGAYLNKGVQPPAKYTEHCKLLWSRGEIKFDGKEWYV